MVLFVHASVSAVVLVQAWVVLQLAVTKVLSSVLVTVRRLVSRVVKCLCSVVFQSLVLRT